MIVGGILLTILMASRHKFALLFNDDMEVVKYTAKVLPWVALFQIAGKTNNPWEPIRQTLTFL